MESLVVTRDFCLPEEDRQYLESKGLLWETVKDRNCQWVLINEFPIPEGYNVKTATAAISIPVGYPVAPLDMVYFYPALSRLDGKAIGATQATRIIRDKTYQMWSRHRTGENPWRPGLDDISSHLGLVEEWLAREFKIR